jgi:threonine dehydratase
LARLLADLAGAHANVIEVRHNRNESTLSVDECEIAVEVETRSLEHREDVLKALRADGYRLLFR